MLRDQLIQSRAPRQSGAAGHPRAGERAYFHNGWNEPVFRECVVDVRQGNEPFIRWGMPGLEIKIPNGTPVYVLQRATTFGSAGVQTSVEVVFKDLNLHGWMNGGLVNCPRTPRRESKGAKICWGSRRVKPHAASARALSGTSVTCRFNACNNAAMVSNRG